MSRLLVAVEHDSSGKITSIYHAGCPWYGIVKQSIEEVTKEEAKFDNAWVSRSSEIWALKGSIQTYTSIGPQGVIKRHYVVLAKSTNYTGDIFFVTDGVDNAKWMTPDDIVKGVMNGIDLANCRMDHSTAEHTILPISGANDFEVVDYKEVQLEYRKYLKGLK